MVDYSMANRTYRYSTATPLFAFGYGLSYSKFNYSGLTVYSKSINAGDTISLSVTVENIGSLLGDEVSNFLCLSNIVQGNCFFKVIQIYVQQSIDVNFTVPHSKLQLVAYERVTLDTNSGTTVDFKITPEQISIYYDPVEEFVVFPGAHRLKHRIIHTGS